MVLFSLPSPVRSLEASPRRGARLAIPVLERSEKRTENLPQWVCRSLSVAVAPALEPLTLGRYDSVVWSSDRPQCRLMLSQLAMWAGALVVGRAEPSGSLGAGGFDEFFRDALRDRDAYDNFFQGGLGASWHPLFASGLLLTTSAFLGDGVYVKNATRALPLLWMGLAANSLPITMAKHGVERQRPFLMFQNTEAIEAFGTGKEAEESFFSGHASTAFFSATFVDRVLADTIRSQRPEYCFACGDSWMNRLLRFGQGAALYGFATAIAYSRIQIDKHFMSDVIAGGVFGSLHGELTYRLGYRAEPDRQLEVSGMPGAYGLRLTWRF